MSELPQDILEIEKRLAKIKMKGQLKEEAVSYWGRIIVNGFRISTEFIGAVLVGLCVGYFLDLLFKTKAVCMIIFSIFGCVSGTVTIYNSYKQMEKEETKENLLG